MANHLTEERGRPFPEALDTQPEASALWTDAFALSPFPADDPVLPEDSIFAETHGAFREATPEGAPGSAQVSCVMICGNTRLLSDETIKQAAEHYRLVIVGSGKRSVSLGRRIHFYDLAPTEESFQQLFDTFDIDVLWYISGYADGQNGMHDEYKCLECIMDACVRNGVAKFIPVTSVESLNFQFRYDITGHISGRSYASGGAFAAAQMDNFILYYAKSHGLKTILLRAPYIASDRSDSSYLGALFARMLRGEKIRFPYYPENKVDFLSGLDLVGLLTAVSEKSADETAAYDVASGYHYTWGDLEKQILKQVPEADISYENGLNYIPVQSCAVELKRQYGFLPEEDVLSGFAGAFQNFKKNTRKRSRFRTLVRAAGNALPKDLSGRIALPLLFLLAGLGLFSGYRAAGVGRAGLWLFSVLYLITGLAAGRLCLTRRRKIETLQKENELLREKYLLLEDVYQRAVENKGEYRQQVLGYQDSFGAIFQAVSRLDQVLPQEIFMHGIQIMEEILENHSIAIYTTDGSLQYARLAASSKELLETAPKSIALSSIPAVYATLQRGEVWKNAGLLPEAPMYAYGVADGGQLRLMVFLREAGPEQRSLYYFNLFGMLCHLIRLSFLRALEYQRAVEQKKYFPGTPVVVPSYFEELLSAQKKLAEAGVANYALLRFASRDMAFVSDSLRGLIRNSDIAGADENGTLFLLLTQIAPESVRIVGRRLAERGLEFELVDPDQQEAGR